jgi:hypothetical protein
MLLILSYNSSGRFRVIRCTLFLSFLTNLLHFIYYPVILFQSCTSLTSSASPERLSNLPLSSTHPQENRTCTFAPNLTVPFHPGTTAPVPRVSTVPVNEPTTAESSLEKLQKALSMKCLSFPPPWSPCFMTDLRLKWQNRQRMRQFLRNQR